MVQDGKRKRRILIVDDHEIVREGLACLLQFEPDLEVVGQAGDGLKAIELASKLQPDAVIIDVNLGEMSGIEATRRILADIPGIKVIGLSMYSDEDVAAKLLDAGGIAYLRKGGPIEDLLAAIRAACL
jgi:DNA-binding NarL/FixJ family response regulator